ncbi:MAG: cobaltochelatase subunit CobN, partial [Bauldia sp.]|nr:cobaltochelatase subunit CobN [Bauldia sp.]
MHLLAVEIARIDDGDVAVDLEQSPGEIVVLSSADSELALLAGVAARRPGDAPTLRLANPLKLAHPASVDLYVEKTLRHAKLIVVRAMGGVGYWPYGLDRLRELARGGGPRLVAIPGEDRWDEALVPYSHVSEDNARRLWRCFVGGGAENAAIALDLMAHLIGRGERPGEAGAVASAGCYWPGEGVVSAEDLKQRLDPSLPVAPLVFYRSILQGGFTGPIDALVEALRAEGVAGLPVFVTSLKDRDSADFLEAMFTEIPPAIVLNATAFAVSKVGSAGASTVLDRPGRPVLQLIFAGSSEEAWRDSTRGLLPRDLTMNVVLPEVDGRLITRTVSFKAETHDPLTDSRTTTYRAMTDRIAFVAELAARWVRLATKPPEARQVALVLSNYPNRDGRIGNGVGLDTPESTVRIAAMMREAGYALPGFPESSADLMALLLSGQTNALSGPPEIPPDLPAESVLNVMADTPSNLPLEGRSKSPSRRRRRVREGVTSDPMAFAPSRNLSEISTSPQGGGWATHPSLPLGDYESFLAALPDDVRKALHERWGEPTRDPMFGDGVFHLAIHRFGNVVVGVQPARGYNIDPKATYHDPDLVPPHYYLAFYAWLRQSFAADAVVHVGKHGNTEWLPGKALGLSRSCWPEVALGATPLIYPFIVNDPGEGAQAKRRSSAVIVDHLMPAMTRAEIHGPLAELETLIDEFYLAAGVDPRRRDWLENEILTTAERHGLDRDLGLTRDAGGEALQALDAHLCELKELQIRDGLHILGASPEGRQRVDTLVAIARVPRTGKRPADASLHRAIAADLGLDGFDPLDCDLGAEWRGPRPETLASLSDAPWRTAGDTVERIEMLAAMLVEEGLSSQEALPPNLSLEGRSKVAKRASGEGNGLRVGEADGEPEVAGASFEARALPEHLRMAGGERDDAGHMVSSNHPPRHPEVLREAEPRRTHLMLTPAPRTRAVLDWIASDLAPSLDSSGQAEMAGVRAGLAGRFVPPGPSGAPSRGRPDVIPTGRNFYSVDVRAVPTAAAWALGRAAADALALRYFHDHGAWPKSVALSAWSTSNMRTGGDDIAQVLALLGAEPQWEQGTGRVTGFRVMALSELGRPRIDVTLKISGMFR